MHSNIEIIFTMSVPEFLLQALRDSLGVALANLLIHTAADRGDQVIAIA